jgi:hypothetical protein
MEKAAANEHRSVRGKARRKRDLAFSGPAVSRAGKRGERKANPFESEESKTAPTKRRLPSVMREVT